MINIDLLLKADAFKNVSPEQVAALRELTAKLEGKSAAEALPLLMEYSKKAKGNKKFTKDEEKAMLAAFMEALPEGEREAMRNMMKMLEKFSSAGK